MNTRNKYLASATALAFAMTGLLSSTSALAALTVDCDGDCTSTTTGGRWDQNFGNDVNNCLYLLGTNPVRRNEAPVGPGAIETSDPESCLGGLDTPNLVSMGSVQARVFSGAGADETVAYSWTYPVGDSLVSASQFIPDACNIGDFDSTNPVNVRNGGFDNGDTDVTGPRPVVDPLSVEFMLGDDVKGNAVLSYYFMNGTNECRDQNWDLYVNGSGTPVQSGVISAFAEGKYLVFDLNGLNGGDTFRLDLGIGPVSPGCEENPTNRTVSGVFISGTSVCGYCGDGYHDPDTEACDGTDPTDTNADICNEACGYCGDGVYDPDFEQCDGSDAASPNADSCNDVCEIVREAPSRTLGYWKTHPTVINGDFGGAPSLLPLDFCGETIEQGEVCEAVSFLRSKGGGLGNFKRQGMAALLNCTAFGCSQDISDLINAGSSACANGGGFDFGAAGSTLDVFNNANDGLALPFHSPSALPKYCSTDDDMKAKKKAKKKANKKAKKKAKKKANKNNK